MRGLTLRPAWAWAVVYGGKRTENRPWQTKYRGGLLIHAGKTKAVGVELIDVPARAGFQGVLREDLLTEEAQRCVGYEAAGGRSLLIPVGCVVAIAELVDVHPAGDAACVCDPTWYDTHGFHFVIDNVDPIRPVAMTGQLGLWKPKRWVRDAADGGSE